jgi:hypothetical protein
MYGCYKNEQISHSLLKITSQSVASGSFIQYLFNKCVVGRIMPNLRGLDFLVLVNMFLHGKREFGDSFLIWLS